MSDIADKIYAATGLTLGAEDAAKIGQMIQAENEKLRAENKRLRAAFKKYFGQSEATNVRAALGEKE
jgi:hypothetical protein